MAARSPLGGDGRQTIVEPAAALFMGLIRTFELVAISVAIGFALAIPLALLRVSRKPYAWMPVYGYIYVMRGTPLLVQPYLIYYGSGQIPGVQDSFLWPFLKEAWYCAIFSFSLNTAAYQAEIFRARSWAYPWRSRSRQGRRNQPCAALLLDHSAARIRYAHRLSPMK